MNSQETTTLKLVIATRESRLALWQANHVKTLLETQGYPVELLGMTTKGDQILDRSLSKVGGKGLFVKELETAMLEGRADIAVHSMKDVPVEFPEGDIPLTGGEAGTVEDVAEVIAFLASKASRHVTGTPIWVDGGQSLLR